LQLRYHLDQALSGLEVEVQLQEQVQMQLKEKVKAWAMLVATIKVW